MGGAWGWVPNDNYKSSKELVQLLVNIVAKGGNLLLGVGPNGKGEFEPKVYENLAKLGSWLNKNGEAIYETTPVEPYLNGRIAYTAKNENTIYAIYMPVKDEKEIPAEIVVKTKLTGKLKITLLASRKTLSYKAISGGVKITIPGRDIAELARQEAVVIRVCK